MRSFNNTRFNVSSQTISRRFDGFCRSYRNTLLPPLRARGCTPTPPSCTTMRLEKQTHLRTTARFLPDKLCKHRIHGRLFVDARLLCYESAHSRSPTFALLLLPLLFPLLHLRRVHCHLFLPVHRHVLLDAFLCVTRHQRHTVISNIESESSPITAFSFASQRTRRPSCGSCSLFALM